MQLSRRVFVSFFAAAVVFSLLPWVYGQEASSSGSQWYKGNTHAHSLWSDGRDFPEFAIKHYRDHGYNFFCLSEHNILADHEFWRDIETVNKRAYGEDAIARYIKEFGKDWVELREVEGKQQVRLRRMDEYAPLYEEPGRFLLIRAEEITDKCEKLPVHLNAINLRELLPPTHGETIAQTMQNNLAAVRAQEKDTKQPVLVHINHPNYKFALTAEEMADQPLGLFLEFQNAGTDEIPGDELHCNDERNWDITNTLRIVEKKLHPYYGTGSDDVHAWYGKEQDESLRAWLMVRAPELSAAALIRAMRAGDYYVSTGVTLRDVRYLPGEKRLEIEVTPEEGVEYTIDFVGTMADCDLSSEAVVDTEGKPIHATRRYSEEVGKVLKRVKGTRAAYELTGSELYVRARVTANKPAEFPTFKGQLRQAWTQPVGWEKRVERMQNFE